MNTVKITFSFESKANEAAELEPLLMQFIMASSDLLRGGGMARTNHSTIAIFNENGEQLFPATKTSATAES